MNIVLQPHRTERDEIRAELMDELKGLDLNELVKAVYGISFPNNESVRESYKE